MIRPDQQFRLRNPEHPRKEVFTTDQQREKERHRQGVRDHEERKRLDKELAGSYE